MHGIWYVESAVYFIRLPRMPCPALHVFLCLAVCMCVYVWRVRVLHRLVGGCCLCGIVPYQYYCSILVLQNNAVGLSKIKKSWLIVISPTKRAIYWR